MRNTGSNVAVALLYQTRELERHLRDALAALGTSIVYEAPAAEIDPAALESSGARVIVVNLDPEVEAHLDDVYGLLDDERYSVVFNDAQVSSGLSGWDQARWTRHLAAKILGATDIDPPRPEDAEAVPAPLRAESPGASEAAASPLSPEPATPDRGDDVREAEEADDEMGLLADDDAFAPARAAAEETAAPDTAADLADTGDPLNLLDSRFEEMNRPAEAAFETKAPEPSDEFDFSTLEALTAVPAPPAPEEGADDGLIPDVEASAAASPGPVAPEFDAFDLAALDRLLETGEEPETVSGERASDEPAGAVDLDFGDLDDEAREIVPTEAPEPTGTSVPSRSSFSGLELSPIDEEAGEDSKPSQPSAKAPFSSPLAAASDWSLEDMLDEGAPPPPLPPGTPAEFGIEKIAPAEYLAPDTSDAKEPALPEEIDFSLELVPLEEAVAPTPVESTVSENWLDPDKVRAPAKIRKVWVLGASIGGPEAVREFLSELPRDYPALFLLAQHMGEEFVDLMAQQLARATELTVRTPSHGERVGHGEVVIVPTANRLQVDPEGVVLLERATSDAAYNPSIDTVLRDAADRYGANAGAIIFSGMTTDAVEGSAYLAAKGGVVYAQHPDTCVVSSMIDGVVETGVVKYLGSPKELAQQLLAEAGKR